ncbi:MAG TPA: NADH-quinone oxidoreductase subunit C [Fervidobacterium sp.]|nr:NADH-quinone oxidoreductase subunit C [Fervidobacterium sp.]HOM74114.1 NADH-quinone oxidoreductase subunit C [Fervidobacterium sp.]
MMNSMNNGNVDHNVEKVFDELKSMFGGCEVVQIDERQYKLIVPSDKTLGMLTYLKSIGYSHLSIITCVDWIEEKKFELVYILFNWSNGVTFLVSTFIDRDKPIFYTVKDMWPTAEYYERDVHEFFGVEFEGNENCKKPLMLELWNDLPPLRKDFDPLKYSKEHFPDRSYDKDPMHEARIIRGDIEGDIEGGEIDG